MFKDLFRHSAIYTLTGFLSRGVSLVIFPLLVRALSKEDFAVYDYAFVLNTIVLIVLPMEITQGLARYYNEFSGKVEQNRACSTVINFTILVHIPLVFIGILLSEPLSILMFESVAYEPIVIYASVFSLCYNLAYTFQNEYKWRLKPLVNTILTLLSSGTILFLVLIFWYLSLLNLKSIFLIMILANGLSVLGGFYVSRRSYSFVLDLSSLRQMLHFSIPLVPSSLGVILAMYIDRLMVKEILSLSELAEYGVGFRIASLAALGFIGIQGALSPLIYKHYSEPDTPKKLADFFTAFVITIFTLLVGVQIFLKDIVELLATTDYVDSWPISSLLIFATVLWQLYIFFPGLSIRKKTRIIAMLNIVFAFINLGFNYFLINSMGIVGAGVATLITSFLFLVTYAIVSCKYYPIPINKTVLTIFIVAFVLGLGLVLINQWIGVALLNTLGFKLGVFLSLALVSLQLIRKGLHFKFEF